jgi:hypothetical protein
MKAKIKPVAIEITVERTMKRTVVPNPADRILQTGLRKSFE